MISRMSLVRGLMVLSGEFFANCYPAVHAIEGCEGIALLLLETAIQSAHTRVDSLSSVIFFFLVQYNR